jgi:hypothetical protein
MIKKTAAKKLDTPQRGVGTGAIAANKEIAALAMAGAEPWQKIIVYLCYGIILLALVYCASPRMPQISLKLWYWSFFY